MKKYLLVFLLFSICKPGLAQKGQQSFGLNIGTEMVPFSSDPYLEQRTAYSFSGGVFYDLNFSRRLGFSIAPGQRVQDLQDFGCFECFWIDPLNHYSAYSIEMPLHVTLNLDLKELAKWKTYFAFGYTYSYLYLLKDKSSGEIISFKEQLPWINRNRHLVNLGFEIRHNLSEKYMLAFHPVTKIQVNQEVGKLAFGLNFKVGRIL